MSANCFNLTSVTKSFVRSARSKAYRQFDRRRNSCVARRNGAGKSTLIKVITGAYQRTAAEFKLTAGTWATFTGNRA